MWMVAGASGSYHLAYFESLFTFFHRWAQKQFINLARQRPLCPSLEDAVGFLSATHYQLDATQFGDRGDVGVKNGAKRKKSDLKNL